MLSPTTALAIIRRWIETNQCDDFDKFVKLLPDWAETFLKVAGFDQGQQIIRELNVVKAMVTSVARQLLEVHLNVIDTAMHPPDGNSRQDHVRQIGYTVIQTAVNGIYNHCSKTWGNQSVLDNALISTRKGKKAKAVMEISGVLTAYVMLGISLLAEIDVTGVLAPERLKKMTDEIIRVVGDARNQDDPPKPRPMGSQFVSEDEYADLFCQGLIGDWD